MSLLRLLMNLNWFIGGLAAITLPCLRFATQD